MHQDFEQSRYCGADDPDQNLVVVHPSVLIGRRIIMSSKMTSPVVATSKCQVNSKVKMSGRELLVRGLIDWK
jgi:hypothetical protein